MYTKGQRVQPVQAEASPPQSFTLKAGRKGRTMRQLLGGWSRTRAALRSDPAVGRGKHDGCSTSTHRSGDMGR